MLAQNVIVQSQEKCTLVANMALQRMNGGNYGNNFNQTIIFPAINICPVESDLLTIFIY